MRRGHIYMSQEMTFTLDKLNMCTQQTREKTLVQCLTNKQFCEMQNILDKQKLPHFLALNNSNNMQIQFCNFMAIFFYVSPLT